MAMLRATTHRRGADFEFLGDDEFAADDACDRGVTRVDLPFPGGVARHAERSADLAVATHRTAHHHRSCGLDIARHTAACGNEGRSGADHVEKSPFGCRAHA